MIDKEKIPTTSLITIMQEMSYTDKKLNNLDNMILEELDDKIKEMYIIELSNQLDYYITLQNELVERGWILKGEEENVNKLKRK